MHPYTNKDQLLLFSSHIQDLICACCTLCSLFSGTVYIIAAFLFKGHEYKLKA